MNVDLINTWGARLKKLHVRQREFAKQVPISQPYFSQLCSGHAANPSLELYKRIETLISAMERREEQAQIRRFKKLLKSKK